VTLASLPEAISWLKDHWAEQRAAPTRLHTHANEGLGPFYTPAFAAALDGSAEAYVSTIGPTDCYHPLIRAGQSPLKCPECNGMGVKDHRTDRYLYPMSRALTRLHNQLGPGRQPHHYVLVLLLADHRFDARGAAASVDLNWDRAEALFLMAIRRLHAQYAAGPAPTRTSGPSWIDKSDSQRSAETAA